LFVTTANYFHVVAVEKLEKHRVVENAESRRSFTRAKAAAGWFPGENGSADLV